MGSTVLSQHREPTAPWGHPEQCGQQGEGGGLQLCSVLGHLICSTQMGSAQHRRDMELLERIQRRATKMMQGMEHLSYGDKLRELGLFSLEKRKLWGEQISALGGLNGATRKKGTDSLPESVVTGQGEMVSK